MSEMKVTRVYSPGFERAVAACIMAFVCLINDDGDGVLEISCFKRGDAEVIMETLSEFGGVLLAIARFEED